jgi:hypothetical protein
MKPSALGVGIALFVASIVLVFALPACRRSPVTENEARQAAQDRFVKVCADFHYDQQSFDGPFPSGIGGGGFAYEWRTKTVGSDFGILITVDLKGVTNVSFLGHIPGVKYMK